MPGYIPFFKCGKSKHSACQERDLLYPKITTMCFKQFRFLCTDESNVRVTIQTKYGRFVE